MNAAVHDLIRPGYCESSGKLRINAIDLLLTTKRK
jgi:hypothetical protein